MLEMTLQAHVYVHLFKTCCVCLQKAPTGSECSRFSGFNAAPVFTARQTPPPREGREHFLEFESDVKHLNASCTVPQASFKKKETMSGSTQRNQKDSPDPQLHSRPLDLREGRHRRTKTETERERVAWQSRAAQGINMEGKRGEKKKSHSIFQE